MNKVLKIFSYVIFGLVSLLIFVYLTFPTDTLGSMIQAQGEAALGFKYQIEIEDVSLAGLTGLSLEGIRITPIAVEAPPEDADLEGGGGPPRIALPTVIDELNLTVRLFSLLGDPVGSFEAIMGDGQIDGTWKPDEDTEGSHILTLNVRDIPVSALGLIQNMIQAPLAGSVTGFVELNLLSDMTISEAVIKVAISGLARGPGLQPLKGGMFATLVTPTRLGNLWLSAPIEDQTLNLTLSNGPPEDTDILGMLEGAAGQPDIDLNIDGRLQLRRPFGESISRLVIALEMQDEWVEQNDFSGIMRNIPLLRQSCTGNQCAMSLSGPLGTAQPQPLRRNRR